MFPFSSNLGGVNNSEKNGDYAKIGIAGFERGMDSNHPLMKIASCLISNTNPCCEKKNKVGLEYKYDVWWNKANSNALDLSFSPWYKNEDGKIENNSCNNNSRQW